MRNEKILVVDDDATFRNFMADLLSGEGYRTTSVMSGEEGLQKLKEERYDLAFLDLNLAGWVSGLDLLREARRLYPEIKVIVCSALTDKGTAQEVLRLGAAKFIEKPIEALGWLLDTTKGILKGGLLGEETDRSIPERDAKQDCP